MSLYAGLKNSTDNLFKTARLRKTLLFTFIGHGHRLEEPFIDSYSMDIDFPDGSRQIKY